jgi:processive 1,2-diacylglycerol beta-glucosyltransferase
VGKRVLILTAGIGSGHNTAGGALEAALQHRLAVDSVERLDIMESTSELYHRLYDDGYFTLVESVPWLVGWGYDKGDAPFKLGSSLSLWDRLNTTATAKAIDEYRPSIIICTHFLPTRLVSLLLNRKQLRTKLLVVTTDYDFQGLWLSSPFHRFFVARDETKAFMIAIGVPADRLTVSGIPVKSVMGEQVDRSAVLQRYALRPDVPILLISAGASGGPYTKTIVQQSLRMRSDFQALVVCGHNEELKNEIQAMVADRADQYRVLGYSTDMPDLMRVATLFIGKPGGLSSSECMASGLPMVLIKPIPGQEVRNSDFLLEEGAAVRCNYEMTVGYKIDELLENPERISRMSAAARALGKPYADVDIASAALNERSRPLWISHAAQRAILAASEKGIATVDLEPARRTRTLTDADGLSIGVITQAQLEQLTTGRSGELLATDNSHLTISRARLRKLLRRRVDPGLLLMLRRMLTQSGELTLQLQE